MPEADTDATVEEAGERRGGFGSLGSILHLLLLTWAAAIASFPLNDNSFFTHLATGRIILDERSVPSTDVYTFTAQGEPWTVQSWLASVAYAGFERIGGDVGLRALVLAVFLTAVTVLWRLTRPADSIFVRLLLLVGTLFVVTDLWSERPYMIGAIGLGVVWLALEGAVRPWLLLPLMWAWVNTHGSWLLALALAGLYVAGAALDRRAASGRLSVTGVERWVSGALVLGMLFGMVGPIGPKIVWFPLTAMSKSDMFAEIIEWQPPQYQSIAERSFLVLAVVTVLLLVRKNSWRLALPTVVFAAGAFYAQRNVVMATVVLVAVAARSAPPIGNLRTADRPVFAAVGSTIAGAALVLTMGLALMTPALPSGALGGYPSAALAWLGPLSDVEGRLGAEVATGNLLEVLHVGGRHGNVFVDDRVDVLPKKVFSDYLVLSRAGLGWQSILQRYAIESVVWRRDAPLASLLAEAPEWSLVYSDSEFVVAWRRS